MLFGRWKFARESPLRYVRSDEFIRLCEENRKKKKKMLFYDVYEIRKQAKITAVLLIMVRNECLNSSKLTDENEQRRRKLFNVKRFYFSMNDEGKYHKFEEEEDEKLDDAHFQMHMHVHLMSTIRLRCYHLNCSECESMQ